MCPDRIRFAGPFWGITDEYNKYGSKSRLGKSSDHNIDLIAVRGERKEERLARKSPRWKRARKKVLYRPGESL